ncbi:retrovirus-related pol polyprotein from transposon TNT 1-94 [Tanacetum coccineum]
MFKSFTTLEKHYISLKVDIQHNLEIFQRDNSVSNQSALSFDQLFELNELKAQSQEKDTIIKKLKERIKSLSGKQNEDKIKKDLEEIETINIELDHMVTKLIAENKHLKQTYKQLYNSIKPARLKNDLRKLKGKALVYNDITKHPNDPEMLKMDVEPITPKLLNKQTTHSAYIKHTQEEATILRDLVEHVKSKYPLDQSLESACRKNSGLWPLKNKDKMVRFTEPITYSGNTITKTTSTSNLVSNKPMLSSIGVKPSTSASGSQPLGDTKKDKIRQTPSSTQKNKEEAYLEKLNLVVQIVLWYLDSGCSKHMTGDRSQLTNFVNKFLGTVKFRNDHVAKILGYGDYQIGNVTISRVYYVEGLGHNLFSVGQFCDSNLEVAFRQHTCFIRNLEGVDLLTGSRGNNLYTLSLGDMMTSSPICLLSKASKTKSWLWHRRLSHLNFGAINHLARHGLVRGLPKLKFEKDHLCSACAMGKSKKKPHKPKSEDTNQEKLYLLHMDLCGPMRVASINGKKYILVIVDDFSRFTWVKFLRSKDEAPDFIIKFLKMIQVRLKVPVRHIRTDNGTEFQSGVVKRRNRTLIEAARAMLIYAKAPLFLWAEAVATACYTQNRSIVNLRHGKTPYELLHDKPPDLSFFHLFGALCYPTNDSDNLGKLQPKADIDFDELTAMASEHSKEVYVSQPDGFVDPDNPYHVYKLKKYDMLSLFLISQDFSKGLVDPTLFIRRQGKKLLLVQIYVNDIIFAASTPELCDLFAKIMCSKFKMSMMGKISFFLGLQISQSPKGIFINQSKYALESLKKYGFDSCDPVDTPMVEKSKLDEYKEGKAVDPSHYHGMIGTLLYLTATFADADHAGCQDTRRSTSGSMQFLGDRLVSWSSKRQKSVAISSTKAKHIAMSGCCRSMYTSDFTLSRCMLRMRSKTLQVVYDVLKLTPFYKAFQISTDVPEIYMQDFWATAIVHHHSIRFKMNNKKHIVNLSTSEKMLQYAKLPNQQFAEYPFKREWNSQISKRSWSLVDQSIPRRNNVNWHYARDDYMFTTIKVIYWHEYTQLYGAILPNELTNEDIKNFESFKEYYAIASGAEPPKTKASVKKKQIGSDKTTTSSTTKGKRLKTSAKIAKPAKKKQPAKTSMDKGLTVLSKVALTEAKQLKLVIERSKTQTHSSHASGSGADEGTGSMLGVPDVPTYESDDEQISWKSSEEDNDDEVNVSEDGDTDNDDEVDKNDEDDDADNKDDENPDDANQDDEHEQTDSDNDGDDFVHPKFSTHDDEARKDDEVNKEERNEESDDESNEESDEEV